MDYRKLLSQSGFQVKYIYEVNNKTIKRYFKLKTDFNKWPRASHTARFCASRIRQINNKISKLKLLVRNFSNF